jgi:hypothetical protein
MKLIKQLKGHFLIFIIIDLVYFTAIFGVIFFKFKDEWREVSVIKFFYIVIIIFTSICLLFYIIEFHYKFHHIKKYVLTLKESKITEEYSLFTLVKKQEGVEKTLLQFIIPVRNKREGEKLISFIYDKFAYLLLFENPLDFLFYFRDFIYLFYLLVIIIPILANTNEYSILLIFLVTLILLILGYKVHKTGKILDNLFETIYYLNKISSHQYSTFYLHSRLKFLLEKYKQKGISGILFEHFENFLPIKK